jgi:hypothetical protein
MKLRLRVRHLFSAVSIRTPRPRRPDIERVAARLPYQRPRAEALLEDPLRRHPWAVVNAAVTPLTVSKTSRL